jgi:anaerobic selenocysteine-containing dehydrogenase
VKAIFLTVSLCVLALVLGACGMKGGANVNVNVNANANAAAKTNTVTNSAPANATVNSNANANANTAKTDSSPKRISFGKGQDWGSETVTLPAGGSAQFVVGAKKGQLMDVEASSPDVKVIMITKGKSDNEDHPNGIGATLNSNGDYVFEVHNLSKKEVKTSVKVTIADGEEGDY